jgi:pimeloyl-ACP methyl ester carboxylesterase
MGVVDRFNVTMSGRPDGQPMVFAHGFGCDQHMWRHVALSAEAVRDIPRASRVVIPNCGHIPHLEAPDQFLSELLPFLAS